MKKVVSSDHTLTHYCTLFDEKVKHNPIKKEDLEKESC